MNGIVNPPVDGSNNVTQKRRHNMFSDTSPFIQFVPHKYPRSTLLVCAKGTVRLGLQVGSKGYMYVTCEISWVRSKEQGVIFSRTV